MENGLPGFRIGPGRCWGTPTVTAVLLAIKQRRQHDGGSISLMTLDTGSREGSPLFELEKSPEEGYTAREERER